jgi:hypothetical protein
MFWNFIRVLGSWLRRPFLASWRTRKRVGIRTGLRGRGMRLKGGFPVGQFDAYLGELGIIPAKRRIWWRRSWREWKCFTTYYLRKNSETVYAPEDGLIGQNILSYIKKKYIYIFFDHSPFSQIISVNKMFHLEPSPRSIEENALPSHNERFAQGPRSKLINSLHKSKVRVHYY